MWPHVATHRRRKVKCSLISKEIEKVKAGSVLKDSKTEKTGKRNLSSTSENEILPLFNKNRKKIVE